MADVYIDRVFLLNFLVDDLLLLCTARIGGVALRRLRLALCALLGAAYAVGVFVLPWLAHPALRLGTGLLMALAAFWAERRRWRLCALFFLVSAALAGAVTALGLASGSPGVYFARIYRADISWPVLAASAVVFTGLTGWLFRRGTRHEGGEIVEVNVRFAGKGRTIPALWDTGNTLSDPVSGAPVLVLEQELLMDLWPEEVRCVLRRRAPAEEKMAALYDLRQGKRFSLLPFRSVGVSAGLLLAYRSDQVVVERKVYRKTLLALTEGPISDGGAYHALWGGERRRTHETDPDADPQVDQPVEQTV